ncbi:YaiI/YqxD family protein [Ghiorsea bivora]|uniref:YaiI/YqxD family protein n=1 Tax=Ghiorsea bivora TaxID=1485545 RepID=UPI000571AD1E|nr:YaiI/YqxD family protein [Ghiorsea bivora]
MKIWVDADACPVPVKEMLFRAAERTQITTTLVANSKMQVPKSTYIFSVKVDSGADVADAWIVEHLKGKDLVITADVPLAADVIKKGGLALSPRGSLFSPETIKAQLTMRNFMDELRGSGVVTGGQAAFSHADRQTFANQLDKILTRYRKQGG